MTLAENIALPLAEYTDLGSEEIHDIVRLKLALVGLKGFRGLHAGGTLRRHVQARRPGPRPGAGPGDSVLRRTLGRPRPDQCATLDELILQLRDSLGATFVVVTHELDSIFAIADNSVFLDAATHTMRAQGNPRELLKHLERPVPAGVSDPGEAEVSRQPSPESGKLLPQP